MGVAEPTAESKKEHGDAKLQPLLPQAGEWASALAISGGNSRPGAGDWWEERLGWQAETSGGGARVCETPCK